MAAVGQAYLDAQMRNLMESIDRKISEDVFAAVLAGAQEVATVTEVNEAGLNAIARACDIDGAHSFAMSRNVFFDNKSNKIDAGSGRNLFEKDGAFGKTFEGDRVFFSNLFDSDTVIAGGDFSKITVCDWSRTELIVDPYTMASTGQVIITLVKIAAVALTNPNAFAKSGTLA